MLRILSWSSGLGCDKVHPSDYDMLVSKPQASSVSALSIPPSMKRKRSITSESNVEPGRPEKLSRLSADASTVQPVQMHSLQPERIEMSSEHVKMLASIPIVPLEKNVQSTTTEISVSAPTSPSKLDLTRQTISTQLSLEILLKHKELRLIDQEMAKCQVALEQLRRCSEIPYPGMQTASELVSDGTGPALRRTGERYAPTSPAPWGVVDGPYSRHYAKWLLPDRRFDGGEPEIDVTQTPGHITTSGRSTRGHYVDVLGGKSIKARSRHPSNLQSLPAGYGQPKEKATGPMILKRKSDGVMVKLVCPDCARHDFGSAQGFINHCRIGHSRSFASHDAAAEACGEPVEYNDNGTIKGVEPVAVSTPTAISVHSLVRSAKLLPQTPSVAPNLRGGYVPKSVTASSLKAENGTPDFQASQQTPHLSMLVQRQGIGLNLHTLVSEAKTKMDLSESDSEDDATDAASPLPNAGSRHPVTGRKQVMKSSKTGAPSPLLHSSLRAGTNQGMRSLSSQHSTNSTLRDSFSGVLPSPTNESTQAPSLVDDDEEFDPQSPASTNEVDEPELHFEIHDDEHHDRVSRLHDLTSAPNACATATTTPTAEASTTSSCQDKHAAFVNASPAPEDGDRKKRKVGGK